MLADEVEAADEAADDAQSACSHRLARQQQSHSGRLGRQQRVRWEGSELDSLSLQLNALHSQRHSQRVDQHGLHLQHLAAHVAHGLQLPLSPSPLQRSFRLSACSKAGLGAEEKDVSVARTDALETRGRGGGCSGDCSEVCVSLLLCWRRRLVSRQLTALQRDGTEEAQRGEADTVHTRVDRQRGRHRGQRVGQARLILRSERHSRHSRELSSAVSQLTSRCCIAAD